MGLGVCRAQYSAGAVEPRPERAIDHLKTRLYSNLYARCGASPMRTPGGRDASRRARRVHLKYLNGLILSIEPPRARDARRDNINSLLPPSPRHAARREEERAVGLAGFRFSPPRT